MSFRFDGFELDPDRYRLVVRNEAVPVEPRVLELLVYLVRHRHRVVPKEELLEALWPQAYVSDSALSRCIYEARRALGDDSRRPRYIQTVRMRGYRFTARVEGPAEAAARTAGNNATATAVEGGGAGGWQRPAAIGALVVAVVLASVWGARWTAGRRADGPPARPEPGAARPGANQPAARLALLPLAAPDDDPQAALVALSMTEQLRSRIGSVPGLVLRSPELASKASADGDLVELAAALGVASILRGTLHRGSDPGRLRIEVVLHTVDGPAPLRATPIGLYEVPLLERATDLARFTRVRDAIVRRVVDRLLPAVELPAADAFTPGDPEAYRLYLLAYREQLGSSCDPGVADLLDRSLERDPRNPHAWELKAVVHWSEVWACGGDAARLDDAFAAAAKAMALAPERVEPRLLQAAIWIETGRVEDAYARILETVAAHPRHPAARYQQVYALRYAGFLDLAESLLGEVLALDPLYLSLGPSGEAPNLFLYQNRWQRFLDLLPVSDTPYHRFYRGFALFLLGDAEPAREMLGAAFRANPADVFGRFSHALLAILDGDADAAQAIVLQIARQRRDLGGPDGEITYKQAQLLALADDRDGALEQLDLAVTQGFFCAPYLRIDPALDSLRAEPAFARILEAAAERHRAFGRRFGLAPQPPLG